MKSLAFFFFFPSSIFCNDPPIGKSSSVILCACRTEAALNSEVWLNGQDFSSQKIGDRLREWAAVLLCFMYSLLHNKDMK